jgi:uncharacterized protein with GYD domain
MLWPLDERKEAAMATYVSLINWTEQGIKNYKETVRRAEDFTNLVEKHGGRVRELLWTIGDHDIVCVLDVPDDETLAALLLQVGALGNIRSKTLKAFDASQVTSIIERTG